MVWSQYVYESQVGTEVHENSDDDLNACDATLLNIDEFYDRYSDELSDLWDILTTLAYDASLTTPRDFSDFLDLAYCDYCGAIVDCEIEPFEDEERVAYIHDYLSRVDRRGLLRNVTRRPFIKFFTAPDDNYISHE